MSSHSYVARVRLRTNLNKVDHRLQSIAFCKRLGTKHTVLEKPFQMATAAFLATVRDPFGKIRQ